MNDSPTNQELKDRIAELDKQNVILNAKLLEQSGFQNKGYTHLILNTMGDSVFVKDEDSRLLLVNDAFCKMFNLPREEIIGKTLAENVSEEEKDAFFKIDKQVLLDGKENINEEILTIDGGPTLVISTRKSRLIDTNGKRFLVGSVRDITARYNSEQALKKSEVEFRELSLTKDKLLSIISHDLRSPFNSISALTSLLEQSIKELNVEKSEEYLGLINKASANTLNLLDNLFNWAKSQGGNMSCQLEPVDLNSLISQVVEQSIPIASAKYISLSKVESAPISLTTDKKMLKTILRNLISNAIKFTVPGGEINVSLLLKPKKVEVLVSDNGVGISEDKIGTLFSISPNKSAVGTFQEKGSGFGLILCKEFIEKLGGNIWAESKVGKGSNFKFTLPLE